MGKAEEFETGHHDRVTVLHTNFNGTRILTASIDHRIKVWQRDPKTGERTLLDTFTAHDADIRDAKFLHPTTGSHIASIGNDLKFHLWTEDVSQAPNTGRRFRRIATIQSTPRIPFVSMDLKTVDNIYTTLALIDRQGLLSIYEPNAPDDFKDWTLIDIFNVCGSTNPPGRGDETSFKVRWDQNPTPLAYINSLSDDRNQLSLVVSVLNEVKIYRSVVSGGDYMSSDGASHRLMFYEAAKIPRHPALVRDVQWAPFSVRGTDRIATACKDGAVRIFELAVSPAPNVPDSTASATTARNTAPQRQQQQQQQSSLTSGLTGRASNTNTNTQAATSSPAPPSTPARAARTGHAFPFVTTIQSTSPLPHAHTDAWSLSFDGQGQVLMSNGSDGVTKLWRKSVLGGQWLVFAGQEVLDAGEETDGDEMDDERDDDE
ncbi:hypothetical protein LTR10_021362 [Elasticomyces elasticus]|uniref:Anaphase-promoting complex subunit 4 WD40 domain-containing protein n=1 Tax=Exophiala sideris TaxID=1016849 RepID=A0ABR0JIJ0_9EURO|nr:hypothetical protein LTR10_021362 [Elasticomyces elasticus]KAK5033417.1 hypothetical protein LTS07_003720 [Exophiala sideris]KAK5042087.1 hypothetical protein LTR13_001893 [Exophiala sideris]KAK5063961.1 hypothetical protein LTR69_003728 [Exophiala sideris]KAK5185355.1 hypothetical protein LTR44_002344 [Eurotiomycetes sp. CCFEE 6388]